MTRQSHTSAGIYKQIRDHALVASYWDCTATEITPQLESVVSQLTADELLGWYDDFNAVLAIMPDAATADYYDAHRFLAQGVVNDGSDVDDMDSDELFQWYDDFDAIMASMSSESVAAYFTSHRLLVAKSIVEGKS